jgi:hypothetical protein
VLFHVLVALTSAMVMDSATWNPRLAFANLHGEVSTVLCPPSRAHLGALETVGASIPPESATVIKVFMELLATAVDSTLVARRATMAPVYAKRPGPGKIANGRLWHARPQSWDSNVLAMVPVTR